MNTSPDQLIQGFQGALLREGLAKSSRDKYVQHVREFINAVDSDAVLTATRRNAEDYLDQLIGERGLSVATIRLRIAALRRFYDYLDDRELLNVRNPFG